MSPSFESRERYSLSGDWQLVFDQESQASSQGWTRGSWPDSRSAPVQVPGIWNLTHPDTVGTGYYRKVVSIPSGWTGRVILLKFLGASYRTEAWLNQNYLGSHEGAYTPFTFDATQAARPGQDNELVVRVTALSKTHPVDGMLLHQSPASKQNWWYTYGGLWGEVFLECCDWVACESVNVDPDLRRELVEIEVGLHNRTDESRPVDLRLQITDPDGAIVSSQTDPFRVPPGLNHYHYTIHLPHPKPWSCAAPAQYQLQVGLAGEAGDLDRAAVLFGMRDFTVQNGTFFLNGEQIYIKGILLQPNYPSTLVAPPDPGMMEKEIRLAKEAGFNLIRIHIRPAAPGFLDLADRYGMLVYAESSLAWIRDSPRLLEHGRRELREMVERDRNHPSVVFWGVYNENPPAAAISAEVLSRYVRSLDPTRVVVSNSGGSLAIDQDFGWIDRALVTPNRKDQREPIHDVHVYFGGLISDPVYNWLSNLGTGASSRILVEEGFGSEAVLDEFDRESRAYTGQILVSELGCGGMTDLDTTMAGFGERTDLLDAREYAAFQTSLHQGFEARRLDRVFGPVQNLYGQAQEIQALADTRQLEALLANPRVSGYILTQLNDVSWEFHGGLLDPWRDPKPAYHALKRLNQPCCLMIRACPAVILEGDPIRFQLQMVCRETPTVDAELTLTGFDPQGEEVLTLRREICIKGGIQDLGDFSIPTNLGGGWHRIEAVLRHGQAELARSAQKVLALAPVDWAEVPETLTLVGDLPGPLAAGRQQNPGLASGELAPVYLAAAPGSLSKADWQAVLEAANQGSTVVLGPLRPQDQLAITTLALHGIEVQLHGTIGSWMGCYHWILESDLFRGLPASQLAGEAYIDLIPHYSLGELGGNVLAGAFRNTQSLQAPSAMLWYSDIEELPFGKGRLIFCQYRVFDSYQTNPAAARLAYNMVQVAQMPIF